MTTQMQDARVRKEQEVAARGKEVPAIETKLADGGGLNEAARALLQRELERAFLAKASPAIAAVARERALWAVFSGGDATLWREPSLDLSEEIARRIDAAP